jgi:hypothetical protein
MKRLLTLVVLSAAVRSLAQEEIAPEALKKMPPLASREELVIATAPAGVVVAIDEAFASQNGNEPPKAPFTIVVPTGKGLSFLPGGKKSGNPELLRLFKATADKRNIEMLRLASLTVPLNPDLADRLKICAHLLKTQALPVLAKDYKDIRVLDSYATKISGNDAVCVLAQATAATGEIYAVKLAGILHPTLNAGVLASVVADIKLSEAKKPEDLSSKGLALVILQSMRFVDPHPAAKP